MEGRKSEEEDIKMECRAKNQTVGVRIENGKIGAENEMTTVSSTCI